MRAARRSAVAVRLPRMKRRLPAIVIPLLAAALAAATSPAGAAPRGDIAAPGASSSASSGASGASASTSASSSARSALKKFVKLQPIQASGGARSVGLEGKRVTVTSNGTSSVITLQGAAPYARIRPFTGSPYVASAAELTQRFSSLLGPSPAMVLTYGSGSGQRAIGVREQATTPVFNLADGSISVTVPGVLAPLSAERGVLRFLATSPDRPVARAVKTSGSPLRGRNSCASETQAGWAMSQSCPDGPFTVSVLGSIDPNQPPPMLTATQQTYAPLSCVTYPTTGATTSGGSLTGTSTLETEDTSTDVSQSLNAGTSISSSYGGLKTNLTASYASSTSQDSNSVYAVAKVSVSGITSTLLPTVSPSITSKTVASTLDALKVLAQCGDAIGTSYTSGAAYTSVLRMQTYDEASAQSLNAKISGSYGPASASASFAGAVKSDESVTNVSVSDVCLGVPSCAQFPGYVPTPARAPGQSSSDYVDAVMNAFTSTFGSVQSGMGGLCTSQTQNCAISITYSPIEDALSGDAKSLVSSASTGVYWMLFNAQAWANAYQSLSTAFAEAATYQQSIQTGGAEVDAYTQSTAQLNALAAQYSATATNINRWIGTSAGTHLADPACAPIMQACTEAYPGQGTSAVACTPQGVSSLGGTSLADPSTLSGPQLSTPAETCNDTATYANAVGPNGSGTYSVTLYLNGVTNLSYTATCVWTMQGGTQTVSTYLPVTGTSQANGVTTTYSNIPFDPSTGTIYVSPFKSGKTTLDPTCPSTGCLPLGMADVTGGTSYQKTSTLDLKVPANLLLASTTSLSGTGTANVNLPAQVGTTANEWNATQVQAGTAYLTDRQYADAGILRVTGAGASVSTPASLPPAPVACTISDWTGSNATPAFAYDSTGNCLITVTGGMNVGGGNTHYITYWAKNGNGQYYYPAAVCGSRSNGGGEETINSYAGPSNAGNQQLQIRYHNTYDSTVTLGTTLTYRSAPPSPAFPTSGYVTFCGSTTPLKGK